MTNKPLTEKDFDDLINNFIKKWIPQYYPHLVDTDDNDGEFLRQAIKDKVQSAKRLLKEKVLSQHLGFRLRRMDIIEIIDACFQIDDGKE